MTVQAQTQPPFSNLQMELLKLFARNLSDKELLEVKLLLSKHFLEKAMDAADQASKIHNWTSSDIEKLSDEHHRTFV